jgi:hypothetical protein
MFIETMAGYFEGFAGIAAIISDRLYPVKLPQEATLPALTYQRVGGGVDITHDQDYAHSPSIQFTCWAETYKAAEQLAEQVTLAAAAWHDSMGNAAFPDEPIVIAGGESELWQIAVDVQFQAV